eukprot:1603489-Rhodomonas_salina.6
MERVRAGFACRAVTRWRRKSSATAAPSRSKSPTSRHLCSNSTCSNSNDCMRDDDVDMAIMRLQGALCAECNGISANVSAHTMFHSEHSRDENHSGSSEVLVCSPQMSGSILTSEGNLRREDGRQRQRARSARAQSRESTTAHSTASKARKHRPP